MSIDILLISDNGLETVGGEQESTKIIINGVKDHFRTGVIQPGKINKKMAGVIYYDLTSETRIKHLIKRPFSFLKYILKVKKIINSEKARVIHTQAQVSFFIVALLKKLGLISKDIKFIHTERGLYTKYNNFFKRLFMFFMKELNVLVTTTEFNLSYWKEAIENKGIALEYKIIENTAGELFETFDEKLEKNNSSELVIGFAGRYTDWKNWPLAVEISDKLNRQLNEKLHVKMAVGCLDKESEIATKDMFRKLKQSFGPRFSGMINIDIEEMDKFYYDIDVFILTSNHNTESFGRTLVEAMSRKTVVLTTDAGGSVEVVGNMKNVCRNSTEFIKRILFFYNNKNEFENEKDSNLLRARKRYSYKNNVDKHVDLYSTYIK